MQCSFSRNQRYEALHGGGGYLVDRTANIELFVFFVSLSIECLVQLRRVTSDAMNKTVLRTLSGIVYALLYLDS